MSISTIVVCIKCY